MIHTLLHGLLPGTHPTPFLELAGYCFAVSGIATIAVTVLIRVAWRRGKRMEDL